MALPALAQIGAEQPNAVFQSTSTMTGSGSSYSANPTLNSDGTASYNEATTSTRNSGPRRAKMEGEDDDHDHGGHIDQEKHIGINVRQNIGRRILNLLLHQLGLGLGYGQVMSPALVAVENAQEKNGEHGQDHGQKCGTGLGEGLVCRGGPGQTHDLRVDGVVAQKRRRGHGAQTGDEGHDRQREQRGQQGGHDHLHQHLEGLGAHVPGGFHGIVVNAADGVAQEQGMVAGTGERHGEEHGGKAREPLAVHAWEKPAEPGGEHAVGVIEELVAGDQGHAGIDQGGHVSQAQDFGTADIKVLREQHNADAHDIDGDHQADS